MNETEYKLVKRDRYHFLHSGQTLDFVPAQYDVKIFQPSFIAEAPSGEKIGITSDIKIFVYGNHTSKPVKRGKNCRGRAKKEIPILYLLTVRRHLHGVQFVETRIHVRPASNLPDL